MILVRPSTEILTVTAEPLLLIEQAGRTCYKSEDKFSVESSEKFVKMLLERGHESVIEHASATCKIVCDRGVTHEIVRHRLASYSQESTRYCDYSGGHVSFVIPPWVACEPSTYERGNLPVNSFLSCADTEWFHAMVVAEDAYKLLRSCGWKPEQARSILPNSLKTEIVMTANFREWRHFFKLRTSPKAHPQMREVADDLLLKFKKRIRVVFDSI